MTINVHVEKCPVPIIWVDTSIIILMAKWKIDASRLSDIEKDRVEALYKKILANVGLRKLICPFAEQKEEVFGGNRKECFDIFNALTHGIQTHSVLGVLRSQMGIAMQSFARRGGSDISLSYRDVFINDPVKELHKVHNSGFYVTINRGLLGGERHVKDKRKYMHDELNKAREKNVQNGKTFEQHLEDEFNSRFAALSYQATKVMSGDYASQLDEENCFAGVEMFGAELAMLERALGKACDPKKLSSFYQSRYYRELPYPLLKSHCAAKLMTDPQPIRAGDFMDIEHAATMMPYVDMFITDKAMRTYLRGEGFDRKYSTKICYIGDSEDINDFFSSL